jgi:hypothetical protein
VDNILGGDTIGDNNLGMIPLGMIPLYWYINPRRKMIYFLINSVEVRTIWWSIMFSLTFYIH